MKNIVRQQKVLMREAHMVETSIWIGTNPSDGKVGPPLLYRV